MLVLLNTAVKYTLAGLACSVVASAHAIADGSRASIEITDGPSPYERSLSLGASDTDQPATRSSTGKQDQGSQLEEVVVTATRRSESVEKVPISIVALGQNELAQSGIKSITDIAAVTPGFELAVPYGLVSTITTISIRGLNSFTGPSVVGIYLDDTPIQVRLSSTNNIGSPYPAVFDLNRVEVARGPQGTLFGAGAEAGTLRFITNSPSLTDFSGLTHAELASTQNGGLSYEAGAAVGGPIVDNKLGFRVSVWDRHDGGYVDRIDPIDGNIVSRNANTDEKLALKGALAFQINEAVRITPSVFYQKSDVDDSGNFYKNFSDPSSGHFANGRLLPEVSTDRLFLPSVKIEAHLAFADLTSTASYIYRKARALNDFSSLWGAIGLVNYGNPLGPGFPGKPSDVSPFPFGNTVQGFTEEIRLASNNPEAFFTWVAGIFNDHRNQVDFFSQNSLAINPAGGKLDNFYQLVTDNQIAAFAQGDFHLSQKWTATLGDRIAKVKTDQTNAQDGIFAAGIPLVAKTTLEETPSTPRVALSYQADRSDLFYVAAGKGFRIGGGNQPLPSFCNITIPSDVTSDYVWSYEVGAKNTLFDGKVQIDSSIFHIDWSKIQELIPIPSCGNVYSANAGSATSNGFDLALQAIVTDRMRVNLKVGYVDAYFTKDILDGSGNPLVLKGDKLGFLPQVNSPWDVNTSVNYEMPLPDGAQIHLRGEYQYHSHNPGPFSTQIPSSASYYPLFRADPPTHLINARAGATVDKLDVTLFVDNVFNAHPLLSIYQDAPTSNLITYRTFRPRTVGLSATFQF
jgi:iron complex outermembrane receptor protein